jgi:rhodanese-related sulfurtransferase
VRLDEEFSADPNLIPGAMRRSHLDVEEWASGMMGQPVVVVCNKGQMLSEGTAARLRCSDIDAEILEGGHQGWRNAEHPTVPAAKIPKRDGRGRTVWVTRSRPKIDRIACPWLIRRFVDPTALFLFVTSSEVLSVAEPGGADTARLDLSPEAPGLLAASLGLSRMFDDDLEQLDAGLLHYDAFYRWCRDATRETHDWPTSKPRR